MSLDFIARHPHSVAVKRVWIAIVVVFAAPAGVIGWQMAQPSDEPVYKGRTLTSWLEDYRHPAHNHESFEVNPAAEEAIRRIGTDGIPTLLRLVRADDSALKVKVMDLLQRQHLVKVEYKPAVVWNQLATCGFKALGTNAAGAVSELIQIVSRNISLHSQSAAIDSLGCIGPPAKQAVPHLLQWGTNAHLGYESIRTLGRIGASAQEAVPLLLQWATNADVDVRNCAKWSLLQIDPQAAARTGITNAP